MSEKYKIRNPERAYFITMTIVGWIDVFTRKRYKMTIIDSLKYCQTEKGLVLYGFCLMSNHMHLIAGVEGKCSLSEILRDFKKFTSKAIVKQIINENESRREWMLGYLRSAGKAGREVYKFWQDGNHPEEIITNYFFDQKLKYIHNNPVKEMVVENPEDYLFSSARNYAGLSSVIDIVFESRKQERCG